MDLSERSTEIELMDDLDCKGEVLVQTLRELEYINKWLGGNNVTIGALNKLKARFPPHQTITIADLGCGGGDMLRIIDRWARRNNISVNLVGVDANKNIIEYARQNLADLPNVSLYALDIFSQMFTKMTFDVVIGTLFFHHFSQENLTQFFSQLKGQARIAIVINDIHRHFLAYHSIKYLTQLFSKSPMVIHDAPLSVRRAFTFEEITTVIKNAGIPEFDISWKWAFRWQIITYHAQTGL